MKKLCLITLLTFQMALSQSIPSDSSFSMLSANLIAGLIPDIEDGYGVAFKDFNNDGYADIYLVCFRHLNRLLVNNGGIIPFVDRTIQSGLGGYLMPRGQSNLELGASAADYDNDGLCDIFLAGWGKTHKLFHNNGQLFFEDRTDRLSLYGGVNANTGLWFDANNDGFLDLYVTDEHRSNRLLINNRKGGFDEQPWFISMRDTVNSQGGCVSDFDQDGDNDLYIANWLAPDYLLINNGRGQFETAKLSVPTLLEKTSSNSATSGDIDNDGDTDLLIASRDGKIYLYYNQLKQGGFGFTADSTHAFYETGQNSYGILLQDFNHDGWLDCFITARGINRLYLNDGKGSFNSDYDTNNQRAYSTGAATADFDVDGDLDLFVANKNAVSQIYLNPTNRDDYIKLKLLGISSNREAFGSKVFFYHVHDSSRRLLGIRELQAQSGYLSSSQPIVHFGTSTYEQLEARIIFPSGKTVYQKELTPGQTYLIQEYATLSGFFLKLYHRIIFHMQRPNVWLTIGLLILYLTFIVLYFNWGSIRYRWSNSVILLQVSILILMTLSILIVLRDASLLSNLKILNAGLIAVILLGIVYSEFVNSVRKKRIYFRKSLQAVSDSMINIHDNDKIINSLINNLLLHEHIQYGAFYTYQTNSLSIAERQPADKFSVDSPPINQATLDHLLGQILFIKNRDNQLNPVFEQINANVMLSVKHEKQLYGIIVLQMKDPQSSINNEDLQYVQTVANQMAIAIENNNYIEHSAVMAKKLAEAETREKYLRELEQKNKALDEKNIALTRLYKELQDKESQLIHSEKMASLGQLVAGISHELNNPISFIYANSKTLKDYINQLRGWIERNPKTLDRQAGKEWDNILSDIHSIIEDNISGSMAIKEIILNLKSFSRIDQAHWKKTYISDAVDTCLKILAPQITDSVSIKKILNDDPPIYCNPGQLNQVLVNIISNAVEALQGQGQIIIRTTEKNNYLCVDIEDDGIGIDDTHINNIFDPFFTTKDVNKGTGLGLSISYSIIKKHHGHIRVKSNKNKGTVFTIELPLNQQQDTNG
ncbi:MAG: GHKL domain-containing protein [Caldithrix sp.]|nr:GHKL domain-containing protein [Caldithrix sp.]